MKNAGGISGPDGDAIPEFVAGAPLPSWVEAIAPYGIFTTDRNLRITTWNDWVSNHSGLTAEAVVGRPLLDVFPDLKSRRLIERYRQALAGEISVISTALHQYVLPFPSTSPSSGLPFMLQSARIAPLVGPDGTVGTITIIEDVTQREFQASVLRRQQELDRLLSSALALLLQSKSPTEEFPKIFAMMNPTLGLDGYLSYLTSFDEQSLVLKSAAGVAPKVPDSLQTLALSAADRKALRETSSPTQLSIAGHVQSLQRAGVKGCYSFPLTIGGRVIGLLVFASYAREDIVDTDVAVLERIARYVGIAIDRALRENAAIDASRAKDDFLAALSHELRTPLNPVLLVASDAADNPTFPEEAREAFRMIEHNVRLEARLIDDLLDLTRIEHGKLGLELQLLDVHAALTDALRNLHGEFAGHGLTIQTDLGAKFRTVRADAGRLQQIFWNVIKNSVKFTARGGQIWITTEVTAPGTELVIRIRDTGIGMTQEEILRVFGAFIQGDHAPRGQSHRFGGLGLGLAISQKLVSLHGGRIEAASPGKGRGSTFSLFLPLVAKSEAESSPPLQGAKTTTAHGLQIGRGRTILLVEDHEATRNSLAHLLKRRGYSITTADNMAAALEEASRQSFGLVLSDIGLPDGDGFALMRLLRERHGMRGIALTGYGMEDDVARSTEAGFFAHLTKPINVQLLDRTLDLAFSE